MLPRFTGQVAEDLKTTEPKLSELIRYGKVDPPPPVVGGRRLWHDTHVRMAALALGLEMPDEDNRVKDEEAHHGL